jgi:transcriptional regulator with XRE-family HTH domain
MTLMLEGPTVYGMGAGDDGLDEALAAVEATREGRALRERREAMGMSLREFADKAGLNRGTVANVEAGEARGTSVSAVRSALGKLEHEMGMDLPDNRNGLDLVELVVTGPSSEWRVVVKGPVRDLEELEESVIRLMSRMKASEERPTSGE